MHGGGQEFESPHLHREKGRSEQRVETVAVGPRACPPEAKRLTTKKQ